MTELNNHDLQWVLRRAPKEVLQLMKKYGKDIMAAGGFVRSCVANEKVNDIDLFCPTKELAQQFAKELAGNGKVYTTGNAFTVSTKRRVSVQFIHRWSFTEPVTLLESFDFTIACAAFWFDTEWKSLCHESYYSDLAGKRLVYRSPKRNEDAGGSMLRVLKFYQRGYRIPLDSLGAVVARLIQPLDSNRAYTEDMKARVITGLLREVDPAVDPSHIAHLPSLHETLHEISHETV